MGFTNNPMVKGQRLQPKSLIFGGLAKETAENIIADNFSQAEKQLSDGTYEYNFFPLQ